MKNFMPIVKPNSRMELKAIISRSIKLFDPDCDLNRLDTSDITNMHYMFVYSVLMEILVVGMYQVLLQCLRCFNTHHLIRISVNGMLVML